tara:strand:+ start:1296 stop:2141 length:846 start_codon:yes stop_codon:yes gene_type:complete
MKTEIGNYTLDCDFDPTIQDNSTKKRFPIDDIGFVYNCVFKQKQAFVRSVEAIREVYPESKIYAVSDGGLDYSFLEDENFIFSMEDDFKSPLKNIDGDNFLSPEHQEATKKEMAKTLERVEKGIEVCGNPEWICMTEPDVLIRGRLTYPENGKLLGSRINCATVSQKCLDQFMGMNSLLSEIENATPVLRWGAVPVLFHTETFLKALKIYKDNFTLLDKFTEKHYAPGTFDLFIGLIFALVGEPEVFNSEVTECLRNPQWYTSDHPIVHQYREYYQDSDHY